MHMKELSFNIILNSIYGQYKDKISLSEWANLLSINRSSFSRYLNNQIKSFPINKVYIIEEFLNKNDDSIINYLLRNEKKHYYHGSRNGIVGDISIHYNSSKNDFGQGFYLGESLFQSALFILGTEGIIYEYDFDTTNLKGLYLDNLDWVYFIAYNRKIINNNVTNINIDNYDYISGPIADDRMAIVMESFFANQVSYDYLLECLKSMKLGNQYCLISDRCLKHIKLVETYKLSKDLKAFLYELANSRREDMLKIVNNESNKKKGKTFKDLIKHE